jgi:hypothetical protein
MATNPPAFAAVPGVEASSAADAADALFNLVYSPRNIEASISRISNELPTEWPASWTPLLGKAVRDEMLAERPAVETRFVEVLKTDLSPDELKAGTEFIYSAAAGGPDQAVDSDVTNRLNKTAAGRSFALKFPGLLTDLGAAAQSMMSDWLPRVFGRFGALA